MKKSMVTKVLVFAVILLFIGLSIQPSVAVQLETKIEVEPKDYLFQIIIDIAKNPDVKELIEQYDIDIFNLNIDKNVYRKLLFRDPKLFFNTLFTKPSMSIEYLNECYNIGIELTNINGEDISLEILGSVEIPSNKMIDELNNIISIDEELLCRIETLKEMNKELNDEDYPIICSVLMALLISSIIIFYPFEILLSIFEVIGLEIIYIILYLLIFPLIFPVQIFYVLVVMFALYLCYDPPDPHFY
jgi:hypothetical protein